VPAANRSLLKARQIGYSFVMAAEMLARAHLNRATPRSAYPSTSTTRRTRSRNIKLLHDELPLGYQKRICIDSKTQVAFESRDSKRRIAVIQSLPSKAPRGKSATATSTSSRSASTIARSTPARRRSTIRSKGQLTIGSTPFGQRGKFYEIHENTTGQRELLAHGHPVVALQAVLPRREGGGARRPHAHDRRARPALRDARAPRRVPARTRRTTSSRSTSSSSRTSASPTSTTQLVLRCCLKDAGDEGRQGDDQAFSSPEELAAAAPDIGPLFAGFDIGRTKHPSEL
jgi:hypothetical protein